MPRKPGVCTICGLARDMHGCTGAGGGGVARCGWSAVNAAQPALQGQHLAAQAGRKTDLGKPWSNRGGKRNCPTCFQPRSVHGCAGPSRSWKSGPGCKAPTEVPLPPPKDPRAPAMAAPKKTPPAPKKKQHKRPSKPLPLQAQPPQSSMVTLARAFSRWYHYKMPAPRVERTFSSDIYDKMLDNPRLSSDERVQIQRMRARRRRRTMEAELEFTPPGKRTSQAMSAEPRPVAKRQMRVRADEELCEEEEMRAVAAEWWAEEEYLRLAAGQAQLALFGPVPSTVRVPLLCDAHS